MSCRCVEEQWRRDLNRQRDLAKKTAVLTGEPQVLYRTPDGKYRFVREGENVVGETIEIITQY